MTQALGRRHSQYPDGYMMLEHLPLEQYPLASQNVHRILEMAEIPIY